MFFANDDDADIVFDYYGDDDGDVAVVAAVDDAVNIGANHLYRIKLYSIREFLTDGDHNCFCF